MIRKLLSIIVLLAYGASVAQVPVVPPEFLDETRRLDGDHMRICLFEGRSSTAFDADVSSAVADALLLSHELIYVPASFPLFDDSDFYYALYLHLMNDCDLFAGISLTAGVYPDWLMASSSYYSVPFVLAVTNPRYDSLSAIPVQEPIGVQMGGIADMEFLSYYTALADRDRWPRLPYADDSLMLRRLQDGTIKGALIWLPNLLEQTNGDFESMGIQLAALTPLRSFSAQLAFAYLDSEPFLGEMVNQAIASLSASGALDELAIQHGFGLNVQ